LRLRTDLRFLLQLNYLLPPEPFESLTNLEAKESAEIISMAETIVDEVVTQMLTEAADKVLKKEE
jgi:hypothetical protein